MKIHRPTREQFVAMYTKMGLNFTENEELEYLIELDKLICHYDKLNIFKDNIPRVKYQRSPGFRPEEVDNKYNAWYVKTNIVGSSSGVLLGKKIAIKDNVAISGVNMMNGASTLEGFIPDIDATIVERILDAGGTILGKSSCEYFCMSGGSHTGALGPVINPYKEGYSAGGSSSGSGVLVATKEVDMAIGGDQGGSIRIPASFCGIYGMKPTWGLVPYTGVMPIENTLDHVGPMTNTVEDNAILLEVLAGSDGLDPRQPSPCSYQSKYGEYTKNLESGVAGLKIAVIDEGFGWECSENDVDDAVKKAANIFVEEGAIVDMVSVPWHRDGISVWTSIASEGSQTQMMNGNAMGFGWKGYYSVNLLDAHAGWRNRADELSESLKLTMLLGQYFIDHYNGRFYAKSQNLARSLRRAYDDVLLDYDILLMPTTPMKAQPLPDISEQLHISVKRAFEPLINTAPFDVTGHPAMSVPCGSSDGLPIGMMLVAKHFDEATIYRAAYAYERASLL
ncbi:amidase [Acidithiobacillus ferrianus]|uniref:amidase n=1 Tax=Acidithiobacillus ferrianus TaxID=2678518 RepID=UPI0034E56B4A